MEQLHNLNIERSILSTILFNPVVYSDIVNIIDKDDFYLPSHKKIFAAMDICEKKDLPIDEEFVKKVLEKEGVFDEDTMLEILSTNPLPSYLEYTNEIKNYSIKRQLSTLLSLARENMSTDNHNELLLQIEKGIENIKNNDSLDSIYKIVSTKDIQVKFPEFYLESFFPVQKNEITIISAKGGTGKSYLGLLVLALLKKEHNLKVLGYFSEGDVGITKHRLNKLKDIHKFSLDIDIIGKDSRPESFMKYDRSKNLEVTTAFYRFKNRCKNYDVILIDPLIAFIAGDENSNTEARFFMNLLNEWCTKEDKTLILIHHHSKGENGGVRGAGAYIDAVRLHYSINMLDNKPYFRLIKLEKTNHYNGKSEFELQLFGKSKQNINDIPCEIIDFKEDDNQGSLFKEEENKIELPPGLQDISIEEEEIDPLITEEENKLAKEGITFED